MRDARKSLLARSILRLGSELRLMNLSNQAAAGSTPSLTEIDTRNGFQGPDFILEGVHHPTSALGSAIDSPMYRNGRGLMRRGARYEEALAVSALDHCTYG
jgi:hypothetical protein